jgi:hypothetical protein
VRRGLLVLALLAFVPAAGAARPHVTLITDSVGGSLAWNATAGTAFARGLDVVFELHPCSRLAATGCPAGSSVPPSALQVIRERGRRLGPNVVLDVGYNDDPHAYAAAVEPTLQALRRARVQHVFWVTLRAANRQYAEIDEVIRAARRRHRDVTVVDWNACARGHPDWFGGDGIHLTAAGAVGHALCLRRAVLGVLLAPPPIEVRLALPTRLTRGFRATLVATGGRAPYRFRVSGLPRGVRERGDVLVGASLPMGRFLLHVAVRDARGRSSVVPVPLVVGE